MPRLIQSVGMLLDELKRDRLQFGNFSVRSHRRLTLQKVYPFGHLNTSPSIAPSTARREHLINAGPHCSSTNEWYPTSGHRVFPFGTSICNEMRIANVSGGRVAKLIKSIFGIYRISGLQQRLQRSLIDRSAFIVAIWFNTFHLFFAVNRIIWTTQYDHFEI